MPDDPSTATGSVQVPVEVSIPAGNPESTITLNGHTVSFRGLLALILVSTLCYLTIRFPDQFGKAFESIAIAVIAFYFGQAMTKR